MNLIELKQKLQQPYDRTTWQTVLRETFPNVSILAQPHAVLCENQDVASFLELGSVRLHDDKKLAIFEIVLTPRKKIQRNRVELRNLVAKYVDQETNHGVLVIFTGQNEDYRFTFTAKESEFNDDGEFVESQTAPKRFTYLLGPHETCTTAARRLSQLAGKQDKATLADVVEAFSVEKLNKEFFTLYKEHYTTFVNHLLAGDVSENVFGIPRITNEKEQDKANKPVRDFAKRLLGRLVFLFFLQKKGWLGCPAGRTDWIDGDRSFVSNLFLSCPDKNKFYSTRLVPLFFEALNRPNRTNSLFTVTGTRVPYLNGGLFEHEKLPNDHKPLPVEKLDFPATLFEQVLDFFGQYNFTIDENDPDDHEVGIDPEMLGHIFENLLEDNKDKGVFYTPKPIVQYMCQQSLIHYLQQHLGKREEIVDLVRFKAAGSATDKNNWVRMNAKHIEELLDRLKICDPAIGSGAFPIGLLQEIYWIKLTLDWTLDPAETKLKIIQNSIYGVDIDAGAVEIARLRFWLSLIVDEDEPRPLPNLDYKIMQGDSLLESFEGIPLDRLHHAKGFKVEVFSKQGQGQMFPGELLEFSQTQENAAKTKEITALINQYFGETNPSIKQELHRKIDRFVLDHIDYNLQIQEEKINDELLLRKAGIKRKAGLVKEWKPTKKEEQRVASLEEELKSISLKKAKLQELEEKPERPYFLWHLFFQDVFEAGGFDIVIGNPPYGVSVQKDLKSRYQTFSSRGESYVLFVERGVELLKENGQFCYIMPDTYLNLSFTAPLRDYLLKNSRLQEIVVLPAKVFQDATVDTTLLFTSKAPVCDSIYESNVRVKIISKQSRQLNLETPNRIESISTKQWHEQGSFNVTNDSDESALLARFSVGFRLVRDVADVFYGIKAYQIGKGKPPQTEVIRDTKPFTATSQLNKGFLPFFDGKHIGRYTLLWRNNNWLHYGPWLAEPRNPGKFIGEKILIRKIVGETLIATYVPDTSYCNTLLYVLKFKPDVFLSYHYLLGILNSRFIGWYFRAKFQISADDTFPQIMIGDIQQFPVPEVPEAQQLLIIERVKKILANPNSPNRQYLDAEIDQLVYSLYKLAPEEIAVVEKNLVVQPEPHDKKTVLFSRILSVLSGQSAYFSLNAVKQTLTDAAIELADDTLREYMSEAMASGIVADAGRGWYSRHEKPVSIDPKPVAKIIRVVKKEFPLLDFCCWSTIQFNPFAQHLIAQPTIFLYAESDTLNTVAEKLKENGWDAWADPGKNEVERYIRPGDRTVVLRPSIQKQPESKDQIAPIEKALIDLKIEASRLQLMDSAEVQRIIDTVLGSGLLQLTALLGYSEVKREKIESTELAH